MRKYFISLVVLILLAIGIYFSIGQFSAKPPSPIITVGEKKIEVVQGSYCWDGLINSVCADTSSPPEMFKQQEIKPSVVTPGSEVKIEFKREPIVDTMEVNRWLSNEETENVPLNGNVMLLPEEEGIYIYDVSARWEKGDSSYAFFIEVR